MYTYVSQLTAAPVGLGSRADAAAAGCWVKSPEKLSKPPAIAGPAPVVAIAGGCIGGGAADDDTAENASGICSC